MDDSASFIGPDWQEMKRKVLKWYGKMGLALEVGHINWRH